MSDRRYAPGASASLAEAFLDLRQSIQLPPEMGEHAHALFMSGAAAMLTLMMGTSALPPDLGVKRVNQYQRELEEFFSRLDQRIGKGY